LISGHNDGKIYFWILKPNQILETEKNSSHIYEDLYLKSNDKATFLKKVLIPFKMIKIHFCGSLRKEMNYKLDDENKEKERNFKNSRKILKIYLSTNQKRIYTLNKKSEVYLWYF